MVSPNPSLLSKRVKKVSRTELSTDRYEFLGLNQAEPDLGDPLVGPSSVGANPYPATPPDKRYILVSTPDNPGERYWNLASNIINEIDGDVFINGIVTATQFSIGGIGSSINITNNTISGPSTITIDPATVGDKAGLVIIRGDLYVEGEQFVVNSSTIELADFNVGIATTVTSNELLDGAGIGIGHSSIKKTLTWDYTNTSLKSSENFNISVNKSYKIDGTDVLSFNTLGTDVVNSSLTSLGTLNNLKVNGISTIFTDHSESALKITQTGGGKALLITNEDDSNNLPFTVTNEGKVGIGTLTPTSELWVNGGGYFTGIVTASNFSIGEGVLFANTVTGIALSITGISTFKDGPVLIQNGSLGIGTTNPTTKLWVDGDLYLTGIITAADVNSSSDISLKNEIQAIENPIEKLKNIEGVSFKWKQSERKSMGVVAQNVEKTIPELVSGSEIKSVNYNGLIGLLIEAVKYQQIEIERLKTIIEG